MLKFAQNTPAKLAISLYLFIFSLCSWANPVSPGQYHFNPTPPSLMSTSYLLVDFHSDKVLAEKNIDKRVPPASLTKMMTGFVVDMEIRNGKLNLDDKVTVSRNAWKAPGSRMFLEVGTQVSVRDLLYGIIIQSGNDASIAVAEHIAGSELAFADMMNAYAQMLGMNDTHFKNATGMPGQGHYSTPRDMATLAKALIREFPETYKIYAEKSFTHNGIKQPNRNRLLWSNPEVDGIKTGHTDAAGYCLVASGKKSGMRLLSVIMGAEDDNMRIRESNQLLTWGFGFFETHHLYQAGDKLQTIQLWMGKENELDIGLAGDIYITVPQGQYDKLNATIDMPSVVKAPLNQGDSLGQYRVTLHDDLVIERPIVALNTAEEGGLFSKMGDSMRLATNKLLNSMGL